MKQKSVLTLDLSAAGTTPWFDVSRLQAHSLQVTVPSTGTPSGTVSIEQTNEAVGNTSYGFNDPTLPATSATPIDATNRYTQSGTTFSSGYTGATNNSTIAYFTLGVVRHVRVKWTRNSGTGTMTVTLFGVGPT
jgi:hypothetical protein